MEEGNQEYWLHKAGSEYQWQQQERTSRGNPSYTQQEHWLTDRFAILAKKLGRPVRALEFGCGFGRFAQLLATDENVAYHGYDFSQAMVKPLFDSPPAALAPIEAHVRVAQTVTEAFAGEHFDIIFTVSVLIHNPPKRARELCQTMASMLNEAGEIWLIENALTSLSTRENNWHGGCWVHDFAGVTAPDMDICVFHEWIHNHAAYVLRPLSSTRKIELSRGPGATPRASSLDELRLLGLPRLQMAIAMLDGEVALHAELQAAIHDQDETIKYLNEEIALLNDAALDALKSIDHSEDAVLIGNKREPASALGDKLRSQVSVLSNKARQMEAVQSLRARVADALITARPPATPPRTKYVPTKGESSAALPSPPFDWDLDTDVALMNRLQGFDSVCHVFNREWIGIRAAAGALPGHKLGISAKQDLSASELTQITETLHRNGVTKLVIHGMSEPLYACILGLAKASSFDMYLVWHGAPAMWVMEHERKLAGFAIDLTKRGIVKKMNGMRRGTEPLIGERAYPKLLLNMPPNILHASSELMAPRPADPGGRRIAFIPSWHLPHKNVATCTLAAHVAPEVTDIWLLDDEVAKRLNYNDKVRILGPRRGRAMLETMRQSDIVVNVTLIDCHPMVDLESLAVGTPCLRGPLFLDALEDHPYVQLTETANVLSVADVAKTMQKVLKTPTRELTDMMTDYAQALIAVSAGRYREFLEL